MDSESRVEDDLPAAGSEVDGDFLLLEESSSSFCSSASEDGVSAKTMIAVVAQCSDNEDIFSTVARLPKLRFDT